MKPVDIETALVELLGERDIAAGTKIPNPVEGDFVRVGRTGGARMDVVQERPTILFECFSDTSLDAWNLASDVWGIVDGLDESWVADGVYCNDSYPSTPINFPDPTYPTRNRYQFYAPMTIALEESS